MVWVHQPDLHPRRLSDFLNPLLVKEIRQALKGRLFLTAFTLLVLGAWFVSAFGITTIGEAISWQSSPWLLTAYVIGLQIAVLIFVPLLAFGNMQAETEENTWELICITTMSPRRLVGGKLGSAVVQTLLLSSVLAPCIAFCSLLPGFDWMMTAIALGSTIILSLVNTIFGLMLGSICRNRHWQTFALLSLLLLLVTETFVACQMADAMMTGHASWEFLSGLYQRFSMSISYYSSGSHYGFGYGYGRGASVPPTLGRWLLGGSLIAMPLAYFFLFFEIAVSQVTFEADSYSGRIRLTCSLIYLLQWVLLVVSDEWMSYGTNPLLYAFVVHWGLFGLSACLEPETISSRIRRRLTGWSRWRSAFLPGGSRALVFMLLHLGATPIVATLLQFWLGKLRVGQQVVMWSMYLLIYSTFAVASCRSILAVNPKVSRASLRVGVVIAVVLSMFPSLLLSWTTDNLPLHLFFLTIFNPFSYSNLDLSDWALVTPLVIVALIGTHLNWEIIKRSVLDVSPLDDPIPEPKTLDHGVPTASIGVGDALG